ncbi:hypothetical protein C0J50_11992 [Silurus asotus]|uniref:RNase H type-1 domain-containing protein n=1 Tax=Silurus asotus TaxID=30991 RepID=A0AAD5A7P5_SILAS|nr:hypothetical protein C0J50_11992 [Silurus asotus]
MVTDAEKIVLSHPLILHTSHQAAELFALTRACVLTADTEVTIYTDSRYAFGVAHDFGRIWQSRGFTTADGKPISHASLVQDLIIACHLPSSLAIVKTKAHSSGDTDEVRGNSLADRMAKQAAASRPLPPDLSPAMVSVNTMISAVLPDMDLPSLQASASRLPRHCTPFFVREFHGPTHHGRRGVLQDLTENFCIDHL